MFTKERHTDGHNDRVVITSTTNGWEVREERDGRVVRSKTYLDWHRVERALQRFELAEPQLSGS